MPFGGEEEEAKRRRRRRKKFSALDSKFCFTSSIYVWHTYLHKCTRKTTAEFFANKTSLFFSRLARVFLSNNREGKKKKGSLSLRCLCQPLSKIIFIPYLTKLHTYDVLGILKNANSQQQQQRKERGEQNSSVAHKQQTDIGDDGDNDDDDDDDDDDVSIALCASTSLVVETQRRKKSFDRPSAR